ncbi:capsid portal protein [Saimiriine betaherpesvirus 4]|uniref:Capsid portal protein n=1 Tax=Saimiriine betaherpesvirus 4 TaxID=1535247 RepID=G8XT07_9BETA|nr:capsid portal protein [Saimiriine betaherpesvirus 4]AEV80953.1 capsid portal protein [Saimiriine betaherpesvirus 4]
MNLYHWDGKSSFSKHSPANDLTLSTIRSILAADERLRIKESSYFRDRNSTSSSPVIDIFPTPKTLSYIKFLHGFVGACRGKSIHQILRDPCVLRKQLLYGICKTIFNTVTVKHIADEWKHHAQLFPYHAVNPEDFDQYLELWASSVGQSVRTGILGAVRDILYRYADDDNYGLYIDWLVTVGIVPIATVKQNPRDEQLQEQFVRAAIQKATESHPLARELLQHNLPLLLRIIHNLNAVSISNSSDIYIYKRGDPGKIEAKDRNRPLEIQIVAEPLSYERDRLIYTTPVAHLYEEIIRYDSLCRHQKVCQLLNTFPVKAITASQHEMNCKKIIDMMEKHDRAGDAKKAIIKFLLNVSDSKSRIGIEDSVESFLQDLTPSLVDQTRLLPPRATGAAPSGNVNVPADRDIRDLFKKQMIKCLEEQIQSQIDEIQDLKTINQSWEQHVRELKSLLSRQEHQHRTQTAMMPDAELNHLSIIEAVKKAQEVSFCPFSVDDNRTVANSFFSQFVPHTEQLEALLSDLWQNEYFRTFRLRRTVTAQGDEDAILYSNYTVERVVVPYLFNILSLSTLEPIPEAYLDLSFNEILAAAYDESKLIQYVRFVCNREKARWEHVEKQWRKPTSTFTETITKHPTTRFGNGRPDDSRRDGSPLRRPRDSLLYATRDHRYHTP